MAGPNFYNPYAANGSGGGMFSAPQAQPLNFGGSGSEQVNPLGVQYSGQKDATGRSGFGWMDTQQTGQGLGTIAGNMAGAGQQAALEALQGSLSNSNPLDTQGIDESRQYLRNTLADLPGMESDKISSLDTQSQRGLSNLLSQANAANAGTGNLGSRQASGQAGDITARMGSDYMNGLIQARANALQQGLAINQGLGQIQQGDLAQRAFQLQQGQALSALDLDLMGASQARNAWQTQQNAANKAFQYQQIHDLFNEGGMLAGNSGGAGGSLMGGSSGGAGYYGGSAAAAGDASGGWAGADYGAAAMA